MLWRVLRNIWRVEVSGLRWAHTPRGCVAGSGYLAPERRLFRGLGEIGSELGRTPAPGAFSSVPHGKAQLTRFGSRDTGGSLSVQFARRGSLREEGECISCRKKRAGGALQADLGGRPGVLFSRKRPWSPEQQSEVPRSPASLRTHSPHLSRRAGSPKVVRWCLPLPPKGRVRFHSADFSDTCSAPQAVQ